MRPSPRQPGGWTLVEMMAVALLLGTLASIVLPNYVRIVEAARVGRAKALLAQVRTLQAEFAAAKGSYIRDDATFRQAAGPGITASLKDYSVTITEGRCRKNCSDGVADWGLRLSRLGNPPGRYGRYSVEYSRCSNYINYVGCKRDGAVTTCDRDFEGINPKEQAALQPTPPALPSGLRQIGMMLVGQGGDPCSVR